MSPCANCSAELRPEWKFCVYCGAPTAPGAVRTAPAPVGRLNRLAVLALVLALVGGFPALIFGHIAMRQIRARGERGMLLAGIATILGYAWLVVTVVLLVNWLRDIL